MTIGWVHGGARNNTGLKRDDSMRDYGHEGKYGESTHLVSPTKVFQGDGNLAGGGLEVVQVSGHARTSILKSSAAPVSRLEQL